MKRLLLGLALIACAGARADYTPATPYSFMGNNTATTAPQASLQNLILGTPGFAETGSTGSSQITTTSALQGNTFVEFEIQGLNAGTAASTDFVATADNGTASAHFVDMGINSSGNNSGTYPTGANLAFLESQTDALYVGTVGATTLHFFTNSSDVMTLASGGAVTFPGQTTAGIHTNNASGLLASLSNAVSVNPPLMGLLGTGWSSSTSLFLRADGTWNAPGGSGTVTTSGSPANTYLTSFSGATAITGTSAYELTASGMAWAQTARTSGVTGYFTIAQPADTGITAATEGAGFVSSTATRTWATTGTVALQRENFWAGPTYASASASQTFTDVFTGYMTPPIQGTNAIFTREHTFGIVDSTSASSSITGGLVVATTLGTTATSVGIGAGNINAGGSITGASLSVSGLITTTAVGTNANEAIRAAVNTNANAFQLGLQNTNPGTSAAATGQIGNGASFLNIGFSGTSSTTPLFTNATAAASTAGIWTTAGAINIGAAGTLADTIGTTGGILATGQGGIGYGPASLATGGTVTQATSRTTAVTLNKICGTITGNGTSLAGLGTAVFTVNDTSVLVGDTILLSEASTSASAAATFFKVTGVAAGAFTITELNTTAATADTGIPVWNFVVIHAVST